MRIAQLLIALAMLAAVSTVSAADENRCYQHGDVVTLRGIASPKEISLANGETGKAWILSIDPLCVIETAADRDVPETISVTEVQLIGAPPPEAQPISRTGTLSTGNITQSYAVRTALEVSSGRKVKASETNAEFPKWNVDRRCDIYGHMGAPSDDPRVVRIKNLRTNKCIRDEQIAYNVAKLQWKQLTPKHWMQCLRVAENAPFRNYQVLGSCVSSYYELVDGYQNPRSFRP